MAINRGQLRGTILRLLMKTAAYPGFYTPEMMDDAIQEAMDYVATHMFIANEGWQTKITYLTTAANQISIDVPVAASMIKEVRYKVGDRYEVLPYDDASEQGQSSSASGARSYGVPYRIVDNQLYFNPPMAEGGENYLMLEYMAYPKTLQSDNDFLESHFEQSMIHFIKYRAASICAAALEKFEIPWAGLETSWFEQMLQIVVKRNLQSTTIREFGG